MSRSCLPDNGQGEVIGLKTERERKNGGIKTEMDSPNREKSDFTPPLEIVLCVHRGQVWLSATISLRLQAGRLAIQMNGASEGISHAPLREKLPLQVQINKPALTNLSEPSCRGKKILLTSIFPVGTLASKVLLFLSTNFFRGKKLYFKSLHNSHSHGWKEWKKPISETFPSFNEQEKNPLIEILLTKRNFHPIRYFRAEHKYIHYRNYHDFLWLY